MQDSLMTLSSVARLAGVRRPVVSAWRKRYIDADYPFPLPANTHEEGQSLFEVSEVVQWLSRTGRGNNPEAALDAAAYSLDIDQHFESVTALLALRAAHGESLFELDRDDLIELAEELDPEDESLLSEVSRGFPDHLQSLAEELIEAAFTVAQAFERLLTQRRRSTPAANTFAHNLHPRAATLLGKLAAGLGISRDADRIIEATVGGSDLLIEAIGQLPEGRDVFADVDPPTDMTGRAAARLARRRVMVHRLTRPELISSTDQSGPSITVAHWPGPGDPHSTEIRGIRFLTEISLNLGPDDVALVAGPPSVLIDRLDDEEGAERAELLRTGSVRGVFALPSGLVPSRPRQGLGLWVLARDQSAVPPRERRALIADLAEVNLGAVTESLLADITALLDDPRVRHARAYRFGRILPMYRVLADGGALTELLDNTGQAPSTDGAADMVIAAQQSLEDVSQQIAELLPPSLRIAPNTSGHRDREYAGAVRMSLKSLLDAKAVALLPGHRLVLSDVESAESQESGRRGIPVITAETVRQGSMPTSWLDTLKLADYPNVELTEPGDVVFLANPPAAWVDKEGSSVVLAPARILRPREPGVLAEVLRADINAEHARSWKAWQVRRFTSDPPGLAIGLEQLQHVEAHLRRITLQTNRLRELMVDAASVGAAEISTAPAQPY